MTSRRARPISPTLWVLGPALAALVAALVLAVPARIAGLQAPEPVFALVPAFAWAIVRPAVWPPLVLGGLGVTLDLLWGTPVGLWAACLLAAYAVVFASRRTLAGQDVIVLWVAFAAACGVAFGLGTVLTWLRAGRFPDPVGVALQWIVTIALFPFAWKLVERYEAADTRF